MRRELSSRERMVAAIANREPDYVPCCFMMFKGLQQECADQFEFVERQVELGLDTIVALPLRDMRRPHPMPEQGNLRGLPVRFDPQVKVRDWREDNPDERFPILHREYLTPAGRLHASVTATEDLVHTDRIALFDDFVIPRSRNRLVTGEHDLPALRYLLTPPTNEDIAEFRETAARAKAFAHEHDLLVVGEWGVLFDVACWLCGIEELVFMTNDDPAFTQELLDIVSQWNRRRMEVILEAGIDLFIKRAWYETADFLSPHTYRQFILPLLKKDVQLAHEAGAKFACITTNGYMPFLDMFLESGLDVLIGLDPIQDTRADFALIKETLRGKICVWGGVNGCLTVETGTADDVRDAVHNAIKILAPGGGFILSPVDNVIENNERVWANVHALINSWRECRKYPITTW